MEQKHEVAALVAAWQSRRARRIEVGMPACPPKVSDGDTMMEMGSNDDSAPEPAPVHAGLTMEQEQAQAHFTATMAEEQAASAPMSAFRQAQEELRYNLFLLEQHRLEDGQIYGERTSGASYVSPPNFWGRMWQEDNVSPSTSIIDLTPTGDGQVVDSDEEK
jgi:hypothetical protein